MKYIRNLIFLLILNGCFADTAIIEYSHKKHTVKLGDSINRALPILEEMHSTVPASWLRTADQYYEGGKSYYIHYQRTGHVEDGVMTDYEFTPYVFADNTLVAIGWTVLGGPRTFGNSATAAYNAQQRSQALLNLSNALLQPQTYNYNPAGWNPPGTTCVTRNNGYNTIVNCY